jgi:hypothetical protein
MTGPDLAAMPALIAHLLVEPDLLDALARRDLPVLHEHLSADPAQISALAALDVRALKHYQRVLQRKRLEMLEPIFLASLPAAREQYGFDALAASFWDWYRQPESVPVPDLLAKLAAAWTGYAARLASSGPLDWLGDLSRYEHLRWKAVFFSEPPGALAPPPSLSGTARPVFGPGSTVATFDFDTPVLRRSLLDGVPPPPPRTTRLVTWCTPEGRGSVLRLGARACAALMMCDGSRSIAEIAASVGGGNAEGASRIAELLHSLVTDGALRLTGEPLPAKQQDPHPV